LYGWKKKHPAHTQNRNVRQNDKNTERRGTTAKSRTGVGDGGTEASEVEGRGEKKSGLVKRPVQFCKSKNSGRLTLSVSKSRKGRGTTAAAQRGRGQEKAVERQGLVSLANQD